MKKSGLLLSIGLGVLVMVLVLLIGGEGQWTMAIDRPSAGTGQEMNHTISLPLVTRNHGPAYASPFGIVMYGKVSDAGGLQEIAGAGAKWVTTSLRWSAIEPSKGTFDWSKFDTSVQNAQAVGMDVFTLFDSNPSWAAALPAGPVTDTQDLVDFTTLMAERYDCDGMDDAEGHPCVHYWSFYGEPDNGNLDRAKAGRGYWGHNGDGYAAMLAQVSPAIHNADPKAQVLMGGLAYDFWEEEGGPFVRSFLTDTLAALNAMGGARAYIDGVAFHYYPINPGRFPTILEKAKEIRGIMTNHGVGDLPLICPEMGYWSSPRFGSSERGQANRLVQMFVRGLSEDMRLLSWYKVFDTAVAGSPEDQYPDRTSGLLRVDNSFKPSYYAYKTMTRELTDLRYRRSFGATGVEGYVFGSPGGGEKTVLWSQSGTVRVAFPYTHLRLVDTLGDEFDIWDNQPGSPGDVDGGVVGQIELEIYENRPFYVEQQ
jgi:hypothetical protein